MKVILDNVTRTIKTRLLCVIVLAMVVMVADVVSLNGPNVCMVKQKYNITKRVKYRAPMSVRTYEWCFSMPPRCSRWSTEMRDLTRLETEERIAEVAICCPGYKLKDVSCVPICPNGKTGAGCSEDCPPKKWGPNCVNECKDCSEHGSCSPVTGECRCQGGWQGESCQNRMSTTTTTTTTTTPKEDLLTTEKSSTKPTQITTTQVVITFPTTKKAVVTETTTSVQSNITSPHTPYKLESTTAIPKKENVFTSRPISKETLPAAKYINVTSTTPLSIESFGSVSPEITKTFFVSNSNYNRSEATTPLETTIATISTDTSIATTKIISTTTSQPKVITNIVRIDSTTESKPTSTSVTDKEVKTESTKKPDTTIKIYPTTIKFKPKEIWIRPAQKGESVEQKSKHESHSKYRNTTQKELPSTNTTPRTIIVSIIPTSISSTYKKIALTTATYLTEKNNVTKARTTEQGFTNSISFQTITSTPSTKKTSIFWNNIFSTTLNPMSLQNITKYRIIANPNTSTTNSMSSTVNAVNKLNTSNSITIPVSSTNVTTHMSRQSNSFPTSTATYVTTSSTAKRVIAITTEKVTLPTITKNITSGNLFTVQRKVVTNLATNVNPSTTPKNIPVKVTKTNNSKGDATNVTNTDVVTTDEPNGEETFHILTEPEHITAVMGEKGTERSSVDLISVISIAGGVMMAIITVAVIIVMIERCKKPRYEDVRKMNDIRMQVMIDNNDEPPPYVRSIFHTPLPDPPTTEKCHYQPISTLDRNLKQFMRPVVVQTISPIMLENFRGILECHYDHLPRRNDFDAIQTRRSIAPSIEFADELLPLRSSIAESTIEALKCEAKLDVIDATTSEPLYAEIPCWRPPSEHAIEIVNMNGEAVTEL